MSLPVIQDDPPDERDDAVARHYWAYQKGIKKKLFYCYEVVVEEGCLTVVSYVNSDGAFCK
jgi:hypothetical protein